MPAASSRRPQGTGGLRQRGTRWQSSVVDPLTGKARWRSWPAGMSKREIRDAHNEWVAEVSSGRAGDRSQTLAGYLARWLAQRAADMEPATHTRHAANVAIASRHAGALRLVELDPLTVTEILGSATRKNGKPLSAASRRSLRATLSVALGDAVTWRLIPANPVAAARLPRTIPTERPVPTADQVREMIATETDPQWRIAWQILWGTGCRSGEMLALHWSDVDIPGRSILVRRTMTNDGRLGHATKTRRTRRVGIGDDLADALRAWRSTMASVGLDMVRPDRPLFPSAASRSGIVRHETLGRRFGMALDRIGADPAITPHAVRHAVASELVRRHPVQLVADQLGMSIGMVERLYGSHAPVDEAMAIMGTLSRSAGTSAADA